MSLRVYFDLEESDLEHFRLIMKAARKAAARHEPEEILANAEIQLTAMKSAEVPHFIVQRVDKLRLMINMLSDTDWRLPHEEAARVLNALAYFSEPEDLIPDTVPGLGFLDDAIMIELVVRELRHEIEAYEDFCNFRERARAERGESADVSREAWLDNRRSELQSRMRRRRKAGPGKLRLFR